jgi:ERCC4-type nuclease
VKRRALLRTLGSLEKVRAASEAELEAVPKISRADAALLHRFFHADTPVKNDSLAADEAENPDPD